MVSRINGLGIQNLNRMRLNKLNNFQVERGITKSPSNNNKNIPNNSHLQKIQFLNKMFGLNGINVNGIGKDTKGVDILSVNMSDVKKSHNKIIDLKIAEIAKPQKNASIELYGNSKDIKSNSYEFEIKSKDKSFKAQVDVKEGDRNEDVLNKISSLVNALNCGVNCQVAKDKNNGVALTLTSSETGSKSAFKITDLHGDLVSKLKLNYMEQKSSDAIYSANNKVYQSSTNEISLEGNAIKLKLNSAGNFNIDINRKRCYEDIQENINEITSNLDYLVTHYNNKIGSLPENSFTYEKLTKELKNRQSIFNNIGINTLKNNSMQFQDKHLKALASSNPDLLISSMMAPKGVLNFFNMVRLSDLDRSSSLYGVKGNNIGIFNRGNLLNYL